MPFGAGIAWLAADSRLMISYYRSMKQQLGVDRRLQKVQQELDTNVPVLEGTDVKAMVFLGDTVENGTIDWNARASLWVWRIGRDGIPHSKKGKRVKDNILYIHTCLFASYHNLWYILQVFPEKKPVPNEADITRCRSTPFSATWQGTQQNLWPQEFQIPWICGHRTVAADPGGGNVFVLKGEKLRELPGDP